MLLKNSKRMVIFSMMLLMTVSSLTGCGKGNTTTTTDSPMPTENISIFAEKTAYYGDEGPVVWPDHWPELYEYNREEGLSGTLAFMAHGNYNFSSASSYEFTILYPNVTFDFQYDYITDPDDNTYLQQVMLALNSADAPDIIDLRGQDFFAIARKDYLTDLYTFIDSEEEMKRDDFYTNILSALETDGCLYRITPYIYYTYYKLHTDYYELADTEVKELNELNAFDLVRIYQSYQEKTNGSLVMRESFSPYNAVYNTNRFVNYRERTFNFGNEFINTVEQLMPFVVEYDRERPMDTYLFSAGFTGDFINSLEYINGKYDGRWFEDGPNGEKYFQAYEVLCIPSNAANKELAWEFIKYMLTHQVHSYNSINELIYGHSIYRPGFFKTAKHPSLLLDIKKRGALTTSRANAVIETMDWIDERNKSVNMYIEMPTRDINKIYNEMSKINNKQLSTVEAAAQLEVYFNERFFIE